MVTSPYFLTLNSPEVQLVKNNMAANDMYLPLIHLPTKPIIGAVTIADVHSSTAAGLEGKYYSFNFYLTYIVAIVTYSARSQRE